MDLADALQILAIDRHATPEAARSAYRNALRAVHPDHQNSATSASRRVRRRRPDDRISISTDVQVVMAAWSVVTASFDAHGRLVDPKAPRPTAGQTAFGGRRASAASSDGRAAGPAAPHTSWRVVMIGNDALAVMASKSETASIVIDALHRLGDIAYADPDAGLFEAIVEFEDAPLCSLVCSLQGRATVADQPSGVDETVTEIQISIEAISVPDSPELPPIDAVTRLLVSVISAVLGES